MLYNFLYFFALYNTSLLALILYHVFHHLKKVKTLIYPTYLALRQISVKMPAY